MLLLIALLTRGFILVLLMNEAAKGPKEGISIAKKQFHILPIAPIGDVKEISQLETRQSNLIYGLRSGARRVLELFWPSIQANHVIQDGNVTYSLDGMTMEEVLDIIVPSQSVINQ